MEGLTIGMMMVIVVMMMMMPMVMVRGDDHDDAHDNYCLERCHWVRSWWTRRTPREGRGKSSGRGRQQLPEQFLLRDFIQRAHIAEKVSGLWDFYLPANSAIKYIIVSMSM